MSGTKEAKVPKAATCGFSASKQELTADRALPTWPLRAAQCAGVRPSAAQRRRLSGSSKPHYALERCRVRGGTALPATAGVHTVQQLQSSNLPVLGGHMCGAVTLRNRPPGGADIEPRQPHAGQSSSQAKRCDVRGYVGACKRLETVLEARRCQLKPSEAEPSASMASRALCEKTKKAHASSKRRCRTSETRFSGERASAGCSDSQPIESRASSNAFLLGLRAVKNSSELIATKRKRRSEF